MSTLFGRNQEEFKNKGMDIFNKAMDYKTDFISTYFGENASPNVFIPIDYIDENDIYGDVKNLQMSNLVKSLSQITKPGLNEAVKAEKKSVVNAIKSQKTKLKVFESIGLLKEYNSYKNDMYSAVAIQDILDSKKGLSDKSRKEFTEIHDNMIRVKKELTKYKEEFANTDDGNLGLESPAVKSFIHKFESIDRSISKIMDSSKNPEIKYGLFSVFPEYMTKDQTEWSKKKVAYEDIQEYNKRQKHIIKTQAGNINNLTKEQMSNEDVFHDRTYNEQELEGQKAMDMASLTPGAVRARELDENKGFNSRSKGMTFGGAKDFDTKYKEARSKGYSINAAEIYARIRIGENVSKIEQNDFVDEGFKIATAVKKQMDNQARKKKASNNTTRGSSTYTDNQNATNNKKISITGLMPPELQRMINSGKVKIDDVEENPNET